MERSLAFYRDLLGFRESDSGDSSIALSSSTSMREDIILTEVRNARPRPRRTTGLFHVAMRLPHRSSLATLVRRVLESGWPILGAANHGVSEAVYLSDPDDNGIELYADLPAETWKWENGSINMVTEPLDIENLLSEATAWKGMDPMTDIGHLHLQVADLSRSEQFYHGVLGLAVTQRSYPGALFLAAGAYHHHIGLNIWAGRGAAPPPPDSIGLSSFTIQIPDPESWTLLKQRIESAALPLKTTGTGMHRVLPDPDGIHVEVGPAN